MIPAKITSLNPVQVTGYRLPEPRPKDFENVEDYWNRSGTGYRQYLASKFIAEVENIKEYTFHNGIDLEFYVVFDDKTMAVLSLNQSCFIELTGEGKCRIVKLN